MLFMITYTINVGPDEFANFWSIVTKIKDVALFPPWQRDFVQGMRQRFRGERSVTDTLIDN